VYIPVVNWMLMLACLACVLGFRTSSNLAAAYGIAVTSTMAITTVIFGVVARRRWRWNMIGIAFLVGFFLIIDLAFLGANLVKIPYGGWFPLVVAVVLFLLMTTWKRGSRLVFSHEQDLEQPLNRFLERLRATAPARAPGCAVFLSSNVKGAPAALLANLHYNAVIHEQVLLTTVQIVDVPHIREDQRVAVTPLEQGFYQVIAHFGFMEEPDVPRALAQIAVPDLQFDPEQVPYFVNRTRVIPTDLPGMALWRERLYKHMRHNATSAADFFRLPPSRIFEIGTSVEM
jgi:KUP system potassium uptake protein